MHVLACVCAKVWMVSPFFSLPPFLTFFYTLAFSLPPFLTHSPHSRGRVGGLVGGWEGEREGRRKEGRKEGREEGREGRREGRREGGRERGWGVRGRGRFFTQ